MNCIGKEKCLNNDKIIKYDTSVEYPFFLCMT